MIEVKQAPHQHGKITELIKHLELVANTQERELESLRAELVETKKQLETYRESHNAWREEYEAKNAEAAEIAKESAQFRAELDKAKRENNDLDSKLQEAQEKNSALHAEIADLKADAERWRAHSQSLTKANPGECFHVSDHNRVLYPMGVEGYSLTPEAAIQPVVEEYRVVQAAEALTDLSAQMHSEAKQGEAVNLSDLPDDVQPVTVPRKVLDSMPVDVKAGKFVREQKPKRRKDIAPGKVFRVDGRDDCYIRGAHSQDWNLTQGTSALIQEGTRVIEIQEASE